MKIKSKKINKITSIKKDKKIVLSENIINHIHNYSRDVLQVGLKGIHKMLNDVEFLRDIPLVDCLQFEKICKSDLDDESFINGLIAINGILGSDDIESLKTSGLYQNVLNGTMCKKPTSKLESLNIINAMRTILLSDYEDIIKTLETECIDNNSSTNCDLSNK